MDTTSFNSIYDWPEVFLTKGLYLCWTCTKRFFLFTKYSTTKIYTLHCIGFHKCSLDWKYVYIWYHFNKVLEYVDFGVWSQFFQRIEDRLCLALFSFLFFLVSHLEGWFMFCEQVDLSELERFLPAFLRWMLRCFAAPSLIFFFPFRFLLGLDLLLLVSCSPP